MEDAIELGLRSIYHATFRDAVSGGTVSGVHAASAWPTASSSLQSELQLCSSVLDAAVSLADSHVTWCVLLQCTM